MKKIALILVTLCAFGAVGCSTPAMRIKHNPELFASIPAAEQELIKQGRIALGFTPDMVKLAIGEPDYISQRLDSTGTTEIWRYTSVDYDYAYSGGYYWGGGPYWGAYPRRGRYYMPPYGYYAVSTPATVRDRISVAFRDGRVVEVNQVR